MTPPPPTDAISGLSERLRSFIVDTTYGKGISMAMTVEDIDDAATAIDALQARVKELEDDTRRLHIEKMEYFEKSVDATARALRAEQERDEAYERAAKIIDDECEHILSKQKPTNDPLSMEDAVNQNLRLIACILPDLAAAIRRLAGLEKEGE